MVKLYKGKGCNNIWLYMFLWKFKDGGQHAKVFWRHRNICTHQSETDATGSATESKLSRQ